ncbi:MAG: S49 family peptidase [Planctomycetota bacterium]
MTDTPPPSPEPNSETASPGQPRPPINPAGTSSAPPPPPGYVPAVFVQEPSNKSAASKFLMYILAALLLFSVTLNVYLWGPVRQIAAALSATGLNERLYNPEVTPSTIPDRVVVVKIEGMIDGPTAEFARQAFYRLEQDPPKAVVLRIESGGGGVTASDQIWHAIQSFRAKHRDVPVVASFGGIAASGGYYIAAPCDYIFCERTGITGSIGVLAQVPGAGGLIEQIGLEMNMVIADNSPNKDDANNLFVQWKKDPEGGLLEDNLTDEGKAAMRVLKNLLNDAYDTFVGVVVEGRTAANSDITEEQLRAAATGGIFIGTEALDAKLVDEIGYLDEAIAYAADQAGLSGEPKVTYLDEATGFPLASLIGQRQGTDLTNVTGEEIRQLVDDATAVRLEYRTRLR